MIESLVTISAVGCAVGFIFSMPIAGPISILVTSHALRGQLKYCIAAALGAAIIDFLVCFIAVHGATQVLGLYAKVVPYILLAGAAFLFFVGVKIVRARFDFDHLDDENSGPKRFKKLAKKHGFFTGMLLNASNPSLFFGWLTSSFIVISFVASWGLNVGGLDKILVNNIDSVNKYASAIPNKAKVIPSISAPKVPLTPVRDDAENSEAPTKINQVFYSLSYAGAVAIGTIIWFVLFSYFLVKNRERLKIDMIANVIHGLGIFLCGISLFLLWKALDIFIMQ